MLNDFEEVNRILAEMHDNGMVEPIDDDSFEVYLDDWAAVVGVENEFYPDYDEFQDDGSF